MRLDTYKAILIFLSFVLIAFLVGVDWIWNDQKYGCDAGDVSCDFFQTLGQHALPHFWIIIFIGGLLALYVLFREPFQSPKKDTENGEFKRI